MLPTQPDADTIPEEDEDEDEEQKDEGEGLVVSLAVSFPDIGPWCSCEPGPADRGPVQAGVSG